MVCATLGSDAFAVADNLEAELLFMVAVGREGSGFLVAAFVVDVTGFLVPAAGGGRLTSGEERMINSSHTIC